MMDDFLREHGAADLKVHKDFEFVRHDLKLYLAELGQRDERYQQMFMELAADYLSTVSDETLSMLGPVERICVHMILRRDLEETLRTVDYLRYGFAISTDLVERDGTVYWSAKYLDTPEDRDVMDVTEMGLHRLPFGRMVLHNVMTSAEPAGSRLSVEGKVVIPLRVIGPEDDLELALVFLGRGPTTTRRAIPVRDWHVQGNRLCYRADVDLSAALGALDQPEPVWDVRMEIRKGGDVNVSPVSVAPSLVRGQRIPVRARLGGAMRGHVEPFAAAKLRLAFRQVPDTTAASRLARRSNLLVMRVQTAVRWRSRKAVLNNPALKLLAYRVLRKLPVKPGLVVFESHMGKQYSDSPRYIFEAAAAAGLDRLGLDPVWSYTRRSTGFPPGVRLVRRESWRYYRDLARAEFWVDNQGFPRQFTRRRETTYVQTWHGTPLKRMGFDSPGLERAGPAVRRQHRAMIRRWSALLAPSEYFVETFAKAYGYQGEIVRAGLPRNDLLVRGVDEAWVATKKQELGLPADRRIVLYCPTFRDHARRLKAPYELPIEIDRMRRALGHHDHLVLRTHYLDSYRLSAKHASFVTDLSRHPDVTELMLLADVLVTDYSSVMFDFANTGRPMVFFAYDYETYARGERGTYFDLRPVAPGPVVTTTDELIRSLQEVEDDVARYKERYAAFRARFCEYETGHAAEHVVQRFLTRPGER
jgi:CDP-glycerol glycerophosphotransferase